MLALAAVQRAQALQGGVDCRARTRECIQYIENSNARKDIEKVIVQLNCICIAVNQSQRA